MLLKLMATSIISIQKSHPFALLEQLLHTMPVVGVLLVNPRVEEPCRLAGCCLLCP